MASAVSVRLADERPSWVVVNSLRGFTFLFVVFRCRLFLALRRLSPIILAGEGPCSFAGFLWCGGVALCLRTLFPVLSFFCLSFGLSLLGRGDAIFGSRWRGVVVRVLLRALVWLAASVCSSLIFRCWVCAFCDSFGGPFSSGRGLSSSPSGAWVVRVRGGVVGVGLGLLLWLAFCRCLFWLLFGL
jgi:hypothetical protein